MNRNLIFCSREVQIQEGLTEMMLKREKAKGICSKREKDRAVMLALEELSWALKMTMRIKRANK